MKILVTGCGRTGTQYMASLFTYLGFRSNHERIYTHYSAENYDEEMVRIKWLCADVESSWMAAPFLDKLSHDVAVWHILRDPLKVLRCWLGHKLLDDIVPSQPTPNAGPFIRKYLPQCAEGTSLQRVVDYIVYWNKMVADWGAEQDYRRYQRFHIEQLEPYLMREMLEQSDHFLSLKVLEAAFDKDAVSHKIGSCHHDPDTDLKWSDIEHLVEGQCLKEHARKYSYLP